MNNEIKKIQKFTDLDAWKEGHQLVLMIYKETEKFPEKEDMG
ncbi:MAG: four helix bundle protein [Patescibacteria group bacterium]